LHVANAVGIIAGMCKNIIGILAGIWWLQVTAVLPVWARGGWAVAIAALALLVFCGRRRGRAHTACRAGVLWALGLAAAVMLGYAYAAWRADLRMADALDEALEGRDLLLNGVVVSLPDDNGDGIRFEFEVESLGGEGGDRVGIPRLILLSWYRGSAFSSREQHEVPVLRPGERWRLPVRLKLPHGSAVPGGFDYEAWLLERGLRATGYVRGEGKRMGADRRSFMITVQRLRAHIRQGFEAALPEAPYRGILVALAIGDQQAITQPQWEVLRRTGVQHLVAISGLHVSLVAIAVGGLCAILWRRVSWLALRCPARLAGALVGLAAAVIYALLAGMGIPVQRSLVMLTTVALALIGRRETSARNVLALALVAVLLVDPWAVLAAGFWLSFGAVAVILLTMGGRIAAVQGWRAAVKLQLAITLATVPVLVALFQGFSLASPFANAFAIPLVSFVITPLTMLAAAWPAEWLLSLAHMLTAWMMVALQWLASSPLALYEHPLPPPWLLMAAMFAVVLLILPRGTPARLAALAVLGGFFLWLPPRPGQGEFRAVVLDVGQGLAVHVQTAGHDLLYDSGPLYGRTSDAGERVVVPYLRAVGVSSLDAVVISHDDADHMGGLESIRGRVEVSEIIAGDASTPAAVAVAPSAEGSWTAGALEPVRGTACVSGLRWQWEAVDFTVLAPDELPAGKRRGNAQSCVLRVSGAGGAVLLLTGDIERNGESRMVEQHGEALASTAVVAAHHGSRTSSSPALITAARPQTVIFSAGYRNRYGHPHPQVVTRWTDAGARGLRTDTGGTVVLASDGAKLEAVGWRERHPRYWFGR
jgi:competence protein ComEC